MKTWINKVDVFIALTEFARSKLVEGGIPAEKIRVKPNFVYPDPGPKKGVGEYALFVGRLSPEKGVMTLLEAWKELPHIPLKIVGDGPYRESAQAQVSKCRLSNVNFVGTCVPQETIKLIKHAQFIVCCSDCHEGLPMAILEAFACATPVLAPKIGATHEILTKAGSNLLFRNGDPRHLATMVKTAWSSPSGLENERRRVRTEFEYRFSDSPNYGDLKELYDSLLASQPQGLN
jgi:glycosyltransferase involved in cell wall biosynthesis